MARHRFRIELVDGEGRRSSEELIASDQRAALQQLALRGLTVIALEDLGPAEPARRVRRIRVEERALALRQLAGLVSGGVALPEALRAVAAHSNHPRIAAELEAVVDALTAGETIESAFSRAPKLLPEVARQIVVAGAEAGHLDRVLERLADDLEAQAALRGRLIGALIYPAIVGLVALAVVAALMVYVLPQIVAAFGQTQQKLPLLTRSLIAIGAIAREHGDGLALASGVLGAILVLLGRRLPPRARERLLGRVPLLGDVLERSAQVRLLSTLALLIRGSVPLPRALESTARAVGRQAHAERLQAVRRALERGSGVAAAFESAAALDAMSLELLRQGEAVGDLATALDKAAQLKRQALEQRLHWLATLVEPIMIVVLGGIVLLLVLAVMLPIVTLNSAVR